MRKSLTLIVATAICAGMALASPVAPVDERVAPSQAVPGGPEEIRLPLNALGDPVDFDASLQAGAGYLRQMQADVTDDNAGNGVNGVDETPDDPDDGGWDWVVNTPAQPFFHTTGASPPNIYGVSALGIYYAYLESGDASLFTAMTDAANAMAADAGIRSGADLVFLMLYNALPGVSGTTYRDSARAKYDGRILTYGSAGALAAYIRDVRGVTQGYPNGIIGWDIGVWARAAAMLDALYPGNGYDTDADAVADTLWEDSFNGNPGLFDVVADAGWDPTYTDKNFWWYNLGITGLIDGFAAADKYASEIPGLVSRLLAGQFSTGAISFSYGANTDDEDWQSTAYAMMTLGNLGQATYQDEINRMGYWTGATQDPSGGWVYSSGNHYPEIAGENSSGLYFTTNDVTDVVVDDDFTGQADVDLYNTANGTNYVWGYTAFATVQEGIDAVTGSTVNVAPGTYPASLLINQGLTLLGSGASSTFLSGGIVFGSGTFTGVTIDGFTLTGDSPAGGHNSVIDMIPGGVVTDITLRNCVLDGEATNRYCFYGRTGRVAGTWTWDNNTIRDFRSWYVIDNTGSSNYPGVALTSVVFTNNTVTGLGGSIAFRGKLDEPTASAVISGNTMTGWVDNSGGGGWIWAGIEVNNVSDLTVFDNTITGVPAQGDEGQGLQAWSVTPWTVDIHDNVITGNNEGIYIPGYVAVDVNMACYVPSGSIYNNTISGNSTFGAWISDAPAGSATSSAIGGPLMAESNWWGDAAGPLDNSDDTGSGGLYNPGGLGNAVSDNIDYDPWFTGNIIVVADPETLSVASPVKTVDVKYLGGGSGLLYGYSLKFSWDGTIASTVPGSVVEGSLLSDQASTRFFTYSSGADEITVDCALLGAQSGVSGPGTMFSITFTGLSQGTSPVDLTVVAVRDSANGPLSGFEADDGLLVVDVSDPVVTNVLIENLTLAHTDDYAKDTDNLKLTATVTDDGPLGASDITADLSALLAAGGAAVQAESYAANVATWTVALQNVTLTSDGSKNVTVTVIDGVGNTASGSDAIIADNTPPGAITGFAAATHHERVALSWDDPSGLDLYPYGVVVRYDGGVDYPEYAVLGAYPADENAGDGEASNQLGVPTGDDHNIVARDIYYYTAFAFDQALNYGPAASSAQDRSTNYWLGDVDADTGPGGGDYDGDVDFDDISVLSAAYTISTPPWPQNECDVGPTDDGSRLGIPGPDDIVDFEDLIIFAMNFNVVCSACKGPRVRLAGDAAKAGIPALSLLSPEAPAGVGQVFAVNVVLSGNDDEVKGASMRLSYSRENLELIGITPNRAMGTDNAFAFFWGKEVVPGEIGIDFAVLGRDETIHGSGEVATLQFRILDKGDLTVRFDEVTARGVANDEIRMGTTELAYDVADGTIPSVTRLSGAWPNPFNPTTTVRYELKRAERVLIEVFDTNGRLVRTLVDRSREAGSYAEAWNGADNNGRQAGTGAYFVRMRAGEYRSTAKIIMIK